MSAAADKKTKHEWSPRIWEGCDFLGWLRLLARNRFAVHPAYIYIAVIITIMSFWNTMLRWWQQMVFGKQVRDTRLKHPPIFIIGHWRTGTTLLHEFLILDERHSFPTTYDCMSPNHFLLTQGIIPLFMRYEFSDCVAQRGLTEQHHLVQTRFFDTSHEALRIRVQIR